MAMMIKEQIYMSYHQSCCNSSPWSHSSSKRRPQTTGLHAWPGIGCYEIFNISCPYPCIMHTKLVTTEQSRLTLGEAHKLVYNMPINEKYHKICCLLCFRKLVLMTPGPYEIHVVDGLSNHDEETQYICLLLLWTTALLVHIRLAKSSMLIGLIPA